MIATFFEWRVEPGREEHFRQSWAEVTRRLHAHGSKGSTLFQSADGNFCALARWPDRVTRDAAFAAETGNDASVRLRDLIGETIQRFDLDELDNLWLY